MVTLPCTASRGGAAPALALPCCNCRRSPAPARPAPACRTPLHTPARALSRLRATVVPPPGGPPPALRPETDVPGLPAFLDGLKFGKADGLLVAIAQVKEKKWGGKRARCGPAPLYAGAFR